MTSSDRWVEPLLVSIQSDAIVLQGQRFHTRIVIGGRTIDRLMAGACPHHNNPGFLIPYMVHNQISSFGPNHRCKPATMRKNWGHQLGQTKLLLYCPKCKWCLHVGSASASAHSIVSLASCHSLNLPTNPVTAPLDCSPFLQTRHHELSEQLQRTSALREWQ